MAHSLGYPHPDLMLSQMTARQYAELLTYFRLEHKRKEEAKIQAQESRLKHFFSRKIRQQQNG